MTAQYLLPTVAIFVVALLNPVAAFQQLRPVVATASATTLDAVSRREALAAASAATMLVIGGGVPSDAMAADYVAPDIKTFAFNGIFKDPKHPNGFRIIAASPNKEGTMTMQDEKDGLVFTIPIKSKTDEKGQVSLTIDFSEKGGPSAVVATFNKKDSSIKFPDGNIWKKDTNGAVGVYVDGFAPYPKFRRIIREGETKNDLVVCMVSGKKTFVVSGKCETGSRIVVDFPGGKTCPAKFNAKKGTIVFPDGNTWTRV